MVWEAWVKLETKYIKSYTGVSCSATVSWYNEVQGLNKAIGIQWGDGTFDGITTTATSGSRTWSHVYKSAGTFTLVAYMEELAVGGRRFEDKGTAEIAKTLTIDSFDANPKSGRAPLTVTFTGSASGGFSPISWILNFGDGEYTTGSMRNINISHVYRNPGSYTATWLVEDALGAHVVVKTLIAQPVAKRTMKIMEVIR